MPMLEIIYEITKKIIRNRNTYFKQIISIMLSIAMMAIVECISNFTNNLYVLEENTVDGYRELTVSIETDSTSNHSVLMNEIEQIIRKTDIDCIQIASKEWTEGRNPNALQSETISLYSFTRGCFLDDSSISYGRNMTTSEEFLHIPVTIIPDNLYPDPVSHIGEIVTFDTADYGSHTFRIIGAYDNSGDTSQTDYVVYVNSAYLIQKQLLTSETLYLDYYVSKEQFPRVVEFLTSYLALNAPGVKAEIVDPNAGGKSIDIFMIAIRVIIEFFLAIAFIIGNIGILTMSLIKVNNQIKVFGIKQAIGATRMQVGIEIITESVVVSLIGTLLGSLFGVVIGNLICLVFAVKYEGVANMQQFIFPGRIIAVSILCSFFISLVFSCIPVQKVLKLNITDAIRRKE